MADLIGGSTVAGYQILHKGNLDNITFSGTVTADAFAGNASTATKLAAAKTISLTGDATGSATFDGSGDPSITVTVVDDLHNHVIGNVDGLQTALDAKAPTASPTFTGTVTLPSTTAIGNVTSTELGYLDGVTSAIQTQLNGKTSNTGTVTSVGGTGTVCGVTLSGSVTTSGNLTLGGTLAVPPANITGLTATAAELNVLDGITATTAELNYTDGVTSNIQTQLDAKAPTASPTFTGTVTLPSTTAIGNVTSTELGYLDGVTSAIQTQINGKTSNTGTVTSVGGTGTVCGVTLSGSVTTSGNLTLGGTLAVPPANITGLTATAAELNVLDGITATTAELNYTDGVTSNIQTQLDAKAPTASPTFTGTVTLPSTTAIGNVTSTELGYLDGVTSAIQTQLNGKTSNTGTVTSVGGTGTVCGVTLSGSVTTSGNLTLGGTLAVPPANITGLTATAAELNVLDGITATTAELNYTDGVTSNIQTQLNARAPMAVASATLPATAGWYRIATSIVGIERCSARFEIDWAVSGCHGAVTINAGVMYGVDPTLNQIHYAHYDANGLTKARIVYHTTYTGNYAYLEVYNAANTAIVVTVQMFSTLGWSLVTPSTAGSIPSGYTSRELTFVDGFSTEGIFKSTIETGTAPLQVASTTAVSNLNADLLDGQHSSYFAPIVSPTFTGTVTAPVHNINRESAIASGIRWYSTGYTAWSDYMGQAGVANQGPSGTITPPAGTLVTTWGKRSFIENAGGYGWTFESGANNSTTPTVVAEIRSSDGAAKFNGTVTAPAFSGNASSATKLETARAINGVNFDGSAAITIKATATNPLTIGSYLTGGSYDGSAAKTIAVDGTVASTASKVVVRDGSGDIKARLLRSEYTASGASGAYFMTQNVLGGVDTDNYVRAMDLANVKSTIVTKAAVETALTGNITSHGHAPATTSAAGFMSAEDKQKLIAIDSGDFSHGVGWNDGEIWVYKNLFTGRINSNATGTLKITLPTGWVNTAGMMHVSGIDNDGKLWAVRLKFQIQNSAWLDGADYNSAIIDGVAPFASIRYGYDGTKLCFLLGTLTSYWMLPIISIDSLTMYGDNGWDSNYALSVLSSESTISNIYTVSVTTTWNDKNLAAPVNGFGSTRRLVATASTPMALQQLGFTDLNFDEDEGYELEILPISPASVLTQYYLKFGSNSTATCYFSFLRYNSNTCLTTPNGQSYAGTTSGFHCGYGYPEATASQKMTWQFRKTKNRDGNIQIIGYGNIVMNSASTSWIGGTYMSLFNPLNTTNVTSITITADQTTGFQPGSILRLYKLGNW